MSKDLKQTHSMEADLQVSPNSRKKNCLNTPQTKVVEKLVLMLIKEHRYRTKHVTHEERSRHKTCGTRVSPQKDLMMKQKRVSTIMRTEEKSQEILHTGGKP